VQSVEVNERTGSVLVHHDSQDGTLESINSAVAEVASEIFEIAAEEEFPAVSTMAAYLRNRVRKLNSSVSHATDHKLDLRSGVPLFLLGASALRLVREGAFWGEVPAFVLFYYAWDSFLKLNPHAIPGAYSGEPESDDGEAHLGNHEGAKKVRKGSK
jgi:hypothetical protein